MNGILVIDKPEGMTSHAVVRVIKKTLRLKRAGHGGTLDPFATGVLPIFLDNATKVIPFLNDEFKEYEATLKLGVTTNTLDKTGKITSRREVANISKEKILNVFLELKKETTQIPPMVSAIKRKGVRLYELARKGVEVVRHPRNIAIEKLELLELNAPFIKFFVRCSRGTYVRVLGAEIGEKLGYGAHLTELRRTTSGIFKIEDTVTLQDVDSGCITIIPIKKALSHYKHITVSEVISKKIKNGDQVPKCSLDLENLPEFDSGEKLIIYDNFNLISISEALLCSRDLNDSDDDKIVLRHHRVFN